MLSWILSTEIVRICLASCVLTLGTGRTTTATMENGETWTKTVIAESHETGFSCSIQEMSWDDNTYLRIWMPDGKGNCTPTDLVIG